MTWSRFTTPGATFVAPAPTLRIRSFFSRVPRQRRRPSATAADVLCVAYTDETNLRRMVASSRPTREPLLTAARPDEFRCCCMTFTADALSLQYRDHRHHQDLHIEE